MLIIPVLILACSLTYKEYATARSIRWEDYSPEKMAKLTNRGETVLLFCKPSYHSASASVEKMLQHEDVLQLFNDRRFVPLRLEYDNWKGNDIRLIFRNHGHTKAPMLILFAPDGSSQQLDLFSADDIMNRLAK